MSGVLIVLEQQQRNGSAVVSRISLEALAAGQLLAQSTNLDCCAAVVGTGPVVLAAKIAMIYEVRHQLLETYTADGYTLALQQLIEKLRPAYVVFPHTYQVRDFAPALATRFGQVLISDVVGFHESPRGPAFVRQLFQGKLNADYRPAGSGPFFVSMQAGSSSVDALQTSDEAAPVEVFTPAISAERIRTAPSAPFRESAHTVDLTAAPIIVSVGRGIREQENIALAQALADALGAELAASRPICDAGWVPMERQVGSSGQTVSPKLYVAIGISGAIQHLVGMKGSKTVIAINKDENAPIFEVADYGVVADLFEIVPALTKAILAAKN
jgi:electron transfer flavoprotein alpha subunit